VISRLYPLLVDYSCAQILVHIRSLIFDSSSTFTTYSRHNPNYLPLDLNTSKSENSYKHRILSLLPLFKSSTSSVQVHQVHFQCQNSNNNSAGYQRTCLTVGKFSDFSIQIISWIASYYLLSKLLSC